MCKVLLVDDEHLEREALKIIIEEGIEGAKIIGDVRTGLQAVEFCEKFDPDIIFMDIKMPVMNGIKATEIIKKKDKDKIVIILTAYDDFEFAQKCIKAKADDYILKPARREVVLETIRKHIDIIKSKGSISESYIQTFTSKIKSIDYVGAKEKLNEIIYKISIDDYKNEEVLKVNSTKIVNSMLKASDELGLESNKMKDSHINKKISSMNGILEIRKWLFQILSNIFREIIDKKIGCPDDHLNLIINYIEMNYHKGISLEDVANYVNLNSSYLSKLFKEQYNINISTYITNRKMERAKELLENSDMSVLNIAMELSYNESNYFSKVFKKVVGMTPSQFKNKAISEKEKKLKSNPMTRHFAINNGRWLI